jgi:hypothetical protein
VFLGGWRAGDHSNIATTRRLYAPIGAKPKNATRSFCVKWPTPESASNDRVVTKVVTTGRPVARPENKSRAFARLSGMELGGLEPPTSWVRSRRSPN